MRNAMKVNPPEQVWEKIKDAPIITVTDTRNKKSHSIWYSVATAACLVFVCATVIMIKDNGGNIQGSNPNMTYIVPNETQTADNIIINQADLIQNAKIDAEIKSVNFDEMQNMINSSLSAFDDAEIYQYDLLYNRDTSKIIGASIYNKIQNLSITISVNNSLMYDVIIEQTEISTINDIEVEIFKNGNLFLAQYEDKGNIIYIESSDLDEAQFISYLDTVIN